MKLTVITTAALLALSTAAHADETRHSQGCDWHPVMSSDGETVLYWNAVEPGCGAPGAGGRIEPVAISRPEPEEPEEPEECEPEGPITSRDD